MYEALWSFAKLFIFFGGVIACCSLAFSFLQWLDRRAQLRQWQRERDTRVNRRTNRF
jgi:hypothetical protein